MNIKNVIVSAFAVATFSAATFAQVNPPQPPEPANRQERGERVGKRGGGDKRPGMRRGGMRRGAMMRGALMRRNRMNFDRLNLTDAQKQRIQAIQASAQNSREGNKAQFEEMRNLMRLKRQGLLTTEQGTRLTALQVQMQTQMRTSMEKTRNDIMAVLTADQKTLLNQMNNQRPMRRGMMRMERPTPPPAPNQN